MNDKRYRLTVEFTAADDDAARQVQDAIHGTYVGASLVVTVPDSLQYEISYFTPIRARQPELEVVS